MERLTKCVNGVTVYVGPGCKYPDTGEIPAELDAGGVRAALCKLAAYEDTGLTPEEVGRLKEYMQPFTIQDMDRFREIMQAEDSGRLVILPPVKIGDKAFFVINKCIFEGTVYFMRWEHHQFSGIRGDISAECMGGVVGASLLDFGKTVFLTREAAEAALKEQEE